MRIKVLTPAETPMQQALKEVAEDKTNKLAHRAIADVKLIEITKGKAQIKARAEIANK
jgi:hypothetical protein